MVRVVAQRETNAADQVGGVAQARAEPAAHPTSLEQHDRAPDRARDGRISARIPGWARRVSQRLWIVALLGVVLAAGLVGFLVTRPPGPAPITARDVEASIKQQLDAQAKADAEAPPAASVAYAAIQPSLVLIRTRQATSTGPGQGSGAGVIVNADGTILTALHVVEGASSITVRYTDGTTSSATIAQAKPESDIATLKPSKLPETLVPAVLGGGVRVGSPVFAVGHPLGLANSLSAGVVSGLDRTVRVDGGRKLEHLIQIDAAVNPGNSGGPLLNPAGQVVGIVTGLANPSDQSLFVGIGFAVPIATAGVAAGSPPQ